MSKTTYKAGDRVAYGRGFLKSFCIYTGDMPRMRGTIQKVEKFGDNQLCYIEWDNCRIEREDPELDDGLGHVIGPNLVLLSRIGLEA